MRNAQDLCSTANLRFHACLSKRYSRSHFPAGYWCLRTFIRTGLLALFLPCAVPLLAEENYYLPHIADGQYAGGSIRTTFIFFNTGAHPAAVTMTLTGDDGAPFDAMLSELGPGTEFSFTLEPGALRAVQTDGSEPIRAGAARVTSSIPITTSAIFSIFDSGGRFLTEAGIGSSSPLTDFVIPVDTTENFNTGLALFNFNSESASLNLQLLDQSGQPRQTAVQSLGGKAKVAKFVTEWFPGLSGFRGTLRVTSGRPVAALSLRQNSQPLSYTTLPAVSSNSTQTEFILPQIADGQFAGGSMRTSLLLFNLSPQAASVSLSFTRDDGTPFPVSLPGLGVNSTFNVTLAPRAASYLQTVGSGSLTSGAAQVHSDVPIGVSAIFSIFDTQQRFLTEAGVGASAALAESTIPISDDGAFATGIAFFNPGSTPLTVSLALINEAGERVESAVLRTLEGKGHLARFVGEWFPGFSEFRGSLGVSSSAPVAALTLRQNAAPLSYTTIPVAQGAIAPRQGEGILLNEVRFRPGTGAPQFVELKMPAIAPGLPAGLVLENDKGETYRLPDTLQSSPAGSLLLVLFDGQNSVGGSTVHADRSTFLAGAGKVRLSTRDGTALDEIRWGFDEPYGPPLGQGGILFSPEPGMSLSRLPSSALAFDHSGWVSTPAVKATPGNANPAVGVTVLIPFHGAISPDPQLLLSWYPAPEAVQYRVQIAREPGFAAPVLDTATAAPPVSAGPFAAGNYYWRVQAIGQDGQPADFSPAALITVAPGQSNAPDARLDVEVTPSVPRISQRKDTRMLLLESTRETGPHAWDVAHPALDERDFADKGNCALASIAMINRFYGGNLSQDRIGYEIFKDRVEGPERDLNYGEGLSDVQVATGLSFALGSGARPFVVSATDPGASETFWNAVKTEIDAGRPMIGLIQWILSGDGHAVVIRGYSESSAGRRAILVNDPFFGPGNAPVYQYDLRPPFDPLSPGRWKGFVAVPLSGIAAKSDEPDISVDTDRDGIVDFDETKRFKTDPQKVDTDQDEITDKNDVRYSVFHPRFGYAYAWRACRSRPCRVAMEKNPDSDGGGCYDGFEDNNHDGRYQNSESSNFSRFDDHCHVKGVEIRNENWSLDTPSSVISWQSKVEARFCVGPLLPAQRSDPNAPAGQARVTFSARHTLQYTQFAGCGPFTITNSYDKTYSPNENSGSIGAVNRNALSLAFFPRPVAVEVVPVYAENPPCDANNEQPTLWPASSTIWGGLGFNSPPWSGRVTLSPATSFRQTRSYPVSNGTGQSTLYLWFPPNQGLTSQVCQIP
jgi:hypothetical protein